MTIKRLGENFIGVVSATLGLNFIFSQDDFPDIQIQVSVNSFVCCLLGALRRRLGGGVSLTVVTVSGTESLLLDWKRIIQMLKQKTRTLNP